jgi:hypothetical protein
VLGPGSDPSHENHIHVDLAQRRGGYRMCQWDVRDPQVASVPLPTPRPKPTDTMEANAATAAAPAAAAAAAPIRPSRQPEGAKTGEVRVALRSVGPGNKAEVPNAVAANAAGNAPARGGTTAVQGSSPTGRAVATDGSGNVSPQSRQDGKPRRPDMLSEGAANRPDRARQRRSGG